MLNAVLNNLINIGWAMLIFLCAYLSNVAFSLYYNIKVLLQPFDRQKMINSGLKVATFVVGPDLALCSNHHPSDLCGSAWVGNPGRIHRNFC